MELAFLLDVGEQVHQTTDVLAVGSGRQAIVSASGNCGRQGPAASCYFCKQCWQQMCRTFWTAGTSNPIKVAMMAMTTSNSIKVKADLFWGIRVLMEKDLISLGKAPSSAPDGSQPRRRGYPERSKNERHNAGGQDNG